MATKAQEKRTQAMVDLFHEWMTEGALNHEVERFIQGLSDLTSDQIAAVKMVTWEKREELANRILELQPLGKTERWTGTVQVWSDMVRKAETYREMEWAWYQWSVYANYAN